ncbi:MULTISPECIES: hypothetical protein [Sorangium]|uniref:Peptidase C51 domain-containing protein n=1 Tax=Sorangium cellulosum TaxID=56 RepID=A0A4P2QSN4_SORCE|nr:MULTISPECIES: hypothetical protein [Sorangium]AUX33188.1 uncharacterized protein SOCE836_053420 [Sorangium cellulosum]AUX33245.1 uncharacterized protein SOCE836_053990 [Sorangium cellulosum]WCQ92564.1 hypothetical protein NQZ70_05305 [Sorangium sp. Soce836]
MIPARKALVELARSLDGVGMTSSAVDYLKLIGDGETLSRARELATLSGCALTVRGMWRRAGVDHPILCTPYRTGRAVTDLVEIALDSQALVEARDELPVVYPGDVVIVGGLGYGGPEHVWTVLDATGQGYPDATTSIVTGLDGGQRCERGQQVIRVKTHEITGVPPVDDGRRVRWVIDFGAVWRRWGRPEAA